MPADLAYINPKIVSWAMRYSALSPGELARRLRVPKDRVLAWREGQRHPTFRQARRLADLLEIPFGLLWMTKVPRCRPSAYR